MADIVNEAIQYTVFSNILLLSTTQVQVLLSTSTVPKPSLQLVLLSTSTVRKPSLQLVLLSTTTIPKPSLQSLLTVTHPVSHPHLQKYYINTHTVYISIVMFSESRKDSKTFWSCSQHYCKFPLNYLILASLFLNATPKYFMFLNFPKFQTMYQLGHYILRCDIPVVPLQYTVRTDMWPVNTQLYCSNYKCSYTVAIIRLFMWEV